MANINSITLTLSVDETNQVLFALADKPYKEVCDLIGKIRQQANEQLGLTKVVDMDIKQP